MNCKKTVAGISALMLVIGSSSVSAFAASADDTKEKSFTEGKVNTIVYTTDNVQELDARFYEDLPDVPYVRFTDFYKDYTGEELTAEKKDDGTFAYTNSMEVALEFNADKDTFTTNSLAVSKYSPAEVNPEDGSGLSFIMPGEAEVDGEPDIITVDFSNYNIDFYSDDTDVWLPLPSLTNLFSGDAFKAIYFNDTLFFNTLFYSDYTEQSIYSEDAVAAVVDKYSAGRSQAFAEYAYNELCLTIDTNYGFPGRIPLNDILAEKGLDGMLSEANEDTKRVKEHLLSTDFSEYLIGLEELELYMFDGGHTVIGSGILDKVSSETLSNFWMTANPEDYEGFSDCYLPWYLNRIGVDQSIRTVRSAITGEQEENEYRYVESGDTALFSFDEFWFDQVGWDNYYSGKGDRPDDLISAFYDCINHANDNPEIKNFVVDLGTNGGGINTVDLYMLSLMGVKDFVSIYVRNDDMYEKSSFDVDVNLDGKFDEKDDDVKFDLNFGVICSENSFSCANVMPAEARDAGLVIIGERSGGGSCSVFGFKTAEGFEYSISRSMRFANKNKENIDAGIEPDFNLVEVDGEGKKDFSAVYNMDKLSECFAEFYGTTTTTSSTTTVTTTETTSTTADSSSSSTSTSTETAASTSDSTSSSTSTETTSANTVSETTASTEKKWIGSSEKIGKMAARDYFVKTGENLKASKTTENEDGTLTIELADEDGNVVEKYTVDPVTGKGKDSKGNDVALPQTGNNSVKTVAAAAVAVTFMTFGAAAVVASGIGRKKEDE